MNTDKQLQKARAKRAENVRLGIKPLNPTEKAKQKPQSRVLAIAAFCFECMGFAKSWRNDVKECPSENCPLFGFWPYI